MAGVGSPIGYAPELLAALARVASLGSVTAEALASEQGWSPASARARLSHAARNGLVTVWRPLRGQPSLYTLTRVGLGVAGVTGIEPARVSAGGARHAVLCSLVAAELGRMYLSRRLIGEPELRRLERGGALLASARLPGGTLALHRPDLALLASRPGGRAVSVEVELTVKSPRRLEAICRGWARARHLEGVLYLAGGAVRPALVRAIERSRSEGRIAVIGLEELAAGSAAGEVIERAIAAAA